MSECKNCCKEFKYQWCLQRHLDRKMPCRKYVPNNPVPIPNNPVHIQKNQIHIPNSPVSIPKNPTSCRYCLQEFSTKTNHNKHVKICKEKDDAVRSLEIQLDISYNKPEINICRFCKKSFPHKTNHTRHIKTCKAKQEYRETLEAKLKENQTKQQHITNNTINNNILLNVSAETLKKFGKENTDHITNEYLRRVIGRLGVTLPKVVSTVAKQIYFDKNKPENQTVQITNVRSQWAKVSDGSNYELQPLGEAVSGVRNKVTDLYVERQCDYFDYFMKVNCRIDKLDNLNNQNYLARTLEDKEDQKNASKLKSEIDREVKSSMYNINKKNQITISA